VCVAERERVRARETLFTNYSYRGRHSSRFCEPCMTLLSLSLSRPRQLFSSHYVHTDVEEKSAWTEKSSCWYIMKYTQNVIINFVVFLRCKAGKRNVFAISDGVRFFSFLCVYRFFVSTSRLLQKGSLYSHIKRYRPIAVPLYTLTIMQQALSLSLSLALFCCQPRKTF
jgi:hypothetical protein